MRFLHRGKAKEIGRRCFLTSLTGLIFGIGVILAIFHEGGTRCSLKDALRLDVIGWLKTSAFSLSSQLGILSGPQDKREFNLRNFSKTVISGTIRSCCVVGANADVVGVVNGEKDFIGSRKALLIVLAKS
jgi:hypothetical protein